MCALQTFGEGWGEEEEEEEGEDEGWTFFVWLLLSLNPLPASALWPRMCLVDVNESAQKNPRHANGTVPLCQVKFQGNVCNGITDVQSLRLTRCRMC